MSETQEPQTLWTQAEALRKAALDARKADQNSAHAAKLEAMADQLEQGAVANAIAADLEKHKTKLSKWLDEWKHQHTWQTENDRAVIALSQGAQRVLVLINAGAAVALLGFIGSVWPKGVDIAFFVRPIAWFSMGVVVAALTAAMSYFTQLLYGSENPKVIKSARVLHVATVVTGLSSLILFAGGCMTAYQAFGSRPSIISSSESEIQKKNFPPPRAPTPQPATPTVPVPPAPPNP